MYLVDFYLLCISSQLLLNLGGQNAHQSLSVPLDGMPKQGTRTWDARTGNYINLQIDFSLFPYLLLSARRMKEI